MPKPLNGVKIRDNLSIMKCTYFYLIHSLFFVLTTFYSFHANSEGSPRGENGNICPEGQVHNFVSKVNKIINFDEDKLKVPVTPMPDVDEDILAGTKSKKSKTDEDNPDLDALNSSLDLGDDPEYKKKKGKFDLGDDPDESRSSSTASSSSSNSSPSSSGGASFSKAPGAQFTFGIAPSDPAPMPVLSMPIMTFGGLK